MTGEEREPAWDSGCLGDAVRLATRSVLRGGGPFGALVVDDRGEVVGWGENRVTRDLDPTAHAEIVAIRTACRARHGFDLSGCVLYASCEPCPMCHAAAMTAGIEGVRYAAPREAADAAGFDDAVLQQAVCGSRRTMPVDHAATPGHSRPFELWSARPERVAY
jgi:guanine deaminase